MHKLYANRAWEQLILAWIGGAFDTSSITGMTVSNNKKDEKIIKIEIWNIHSQGMSKHQIKFRTLFSLFLQTFIFCAKIKNHSNIAIE